MLAASPRIVHLDALDVIYDDQRAPALMGLTAVRQKLEVPLDHAREPVGLGNTQAKAVFIERSRGGVPEFRERLRSVTEAYPPARPGFSAPGQ